MFAAGYHWQSYVLCVETIAQRRGCVNVQWVTQILDVGNAHLNEHVWGQCTRLHCRAVVGLSSLANHSWECLGATTDVFC